MFVLAFIVGCTLCFFIGIWYTILSAQKHQRALYRNQRMEQFKNMVTADPKHFAQFEKLNMYRYDPSSKKYHQYTINKTTGDNEKTEFAFNGVAPQSPENFRFNEYLQQWEDRNKYTDVKFALDNNNEYLVISYPHSGGKEFRIKLNTKLDSISLDPDTGSLHPQPVKCEEKDSFTFGEYADMFSTSILPENRDVVVNTTMTIACRENGKPYLRSKALAGTNNQNTKILESTNKSEAAIFLAIYPACALNYNQIVQSQTPIASPTNMYRYKMNDDALGKLKEYISNVPVTLFHNSERIFKWENVPEQLVKYLKTSANAAHQGTGTVRDFSEQKIISGYIEVVPNEQYIFYNLLNDTILLDYCVVHISKSKMYSSDTSSQMSESSTGNNNDTVNLVSSAYTHLHTPSIKQAQNYFNDRSEKVVDGNANNNVAGNDGNKTEASSDSDNILNLSYRCVDIAVDISVSLI